VTSSFGVVDGGASSFVVCSSSLGGDKWSSRDVSGCSLFALALASSSSSSSLYVLSFNS